MFPFSVRLQIQLALLLIASKRIVILFDTVSNPSREASVPL